jgi:hypothetical protein
MAMVYGKPAITNQFILLKPDKNLSNHNFFLACQHLTRMLLKAADQIKFS